jgi:transcriptional regulator with XRE-family HTH domain
VTPAHAVFAASGLTAADVARRARISPAYLRRLLREGAPYHTALRLSRVLGCSTDDFIPQSPAGSGAACQRRGAGRRRAGSPAR